MHMYKPVHLYNNFKQLMTIETQLKIKKKIASFQIPLAQIRASFIV